jgi:hypothetical protein
MAATRTDLIYRALRNRGALPPGQAADADTTAAVGDLLDGMLAELEARDVVYIRDIDTYGVEDKYLQPLGHILAWRAAPEFGSAADTALAALATQAEIHLRHMEAGRPTCKIAEGQYF